MKIVVRSDHHAGYWQWCLSFPASLGDVPELAAAAEPRPFPTIAGPPGSAVAGNTAD